VATALFGIAGCAREAKPFVPKAPPVKAFERLLTLNGAQFHLDPKKLDRPLLVAFLHPQDKHSRRWAVRVKGLAARFEDRVDVLPVIGGRDVRAARTFAWYHGLKRVAWDPEDVLMHEYKVAQAPWFLLLSEKGARILERHVVSKALLLASDKLSPRPPPAPRVELETVRIRGGGAADIASEPRVQKQKR